MIAMDNICSRPPVTVTEKAGVLEALRIRRQHGLRRLPVVNADDVLVVGIVTADDVVELITEALGALSKCCRKARHARRDRNDD